MYMFVHQSFLIARSKVGHLATVVYTLVQHCVPQLKTIDLLAWRHPQSEVSAVVRASVSSFCTVTLFSSEF